MRKISKETTPGDARRKKIGIIFLAGFVLMLVGCYFLLNKPLTSVVQDKDALRDLVKQYGVLAYIVYILLVAVQVIIAVIPGEPFEIAAGVVFGTIPGTLLCMAGALVGSCAVFLLTRRFGTKLLLLFFKEEELRSVAFLQNTNRLRLVTAIVFLIPGTPKDILTYAAGLTDIDMWSFLLISTFARIPSIISSTWGGDALIARDFSLAAIILAGTLLISGIGLFLYKKHFAGKK